MADTYVSVDFVPDELLTSTKMNQLAANQSNFHNGSALGDGVITTRHMANSAITGAKIAPGAILLGFTQAVSDQTGITTTETAISFASASVTVPEGTRNLLLQMIIPNGNLTAGSSSQFRFYWKENSTVINTSTFSPGTDFGQEINHAVLATGIAAGTHTFYVTGKRVNGSGTFNTNFSSTGDIAIPIFLVWAF